MVRSGAIAFGRWALVREVWALAGPAMAHMLLLTLVFLVDRAMLGRYSSVALASMQVSGPIVWSVISVVTAFSAGTIAVVGRSVGAGDLEGGAAAARASLRFAASVGVVVSVLLWFGLDPVTRAIFPRAEPDVLADAHAYLAILVPAFPLAFVQFAAAASLQASGDTRTPLYVAIVANLTNIALDAVLIFGLLGLPRLGIRGAAIGTATAFALEAILLTGVLLSARSPLPLRGSSRARDRNALRRVLAVSWPAFGEKLLYHAGFMGYVAIIGLLGSVVMAANQAVISIESVCFLSAEGFGIAAGALMAQKLGAGRPDQAGRAGMLASGMAMALLTSCGVLFATLPRVLVSGFTDDPTIVAMGVKGLYVAAVAQPFMAFAIVMSAGLRGAGDTRTVLGITLLCAVGVRLVATWILAITLDLGFVGVWLGSTVDWVCRAGLFWIAFVRGRWRTLQV